MEIPDVLKKIINHKYIDEVRLRKYIKKSMKPLGPEIWSILLKDGKEEEYELLVKMSITTYKDNININKDNININKDNINIDNIMTNINKDNYRSLPFYHKLDINKKILHQIQIDIKRLNPKYTTLNNIDISKSYINILLLISHRRYKLGYVQGMADFLVPFLLSCTESQSYFLYLDLIKKIEFNIINLQGNLILRLREEMENIDPILCTYLQDIGLDFHVFSFRWFNCLFFREFKYEEYIKIFTSILAYRDINSILLYIGVGILSVLRGEILKQGYNENVLMIQDISNRKDIVVEKILIIARKLYKKRRNV